MAPSSSPPPSPPPPPPPPPPPLPPGPFMQRINRALHREPWTTAVHGVYWTLVLSVAVPVGIWVLLVRTLWDMLCHRALRRRRPVHFWETSSGSRSTGGGDGGAPGEDEYAVLITGCDTGFGRELAIQAATSTPNTSPSAPRFVVFAGCLEMADTSLSPFKGIDNITVLQMDVTVDEQVHHAVKRVHEWMMEGEGRKEEKEPSASSVLASSSRSPATGRQQQLPQQQRRRRRFLHAVVNNAGIGDAGDADWLSVEHVQRAMDVNYIGLVRVCKAFLPILKRQSSSPQGYPHARILNVTSMAGLVCTSPLLGAYGASKHAAQCWSESLRIELEPWNVQVATINPTFHATPLATNGSQKLEKLWNSLPEHIQNEYGHDYLKERQWAVDATMTRTRWDMDVAIDEMLRCLTLTKVPMRVLVGTDGRLATIALRMLPPWILDMVARLVHPRPVPAAMKK